MPIAERIRPAGKEARHILRNGANFIESLYLCEYDYLLIEIDSYRDESNRQIEKTDAPVETVEADGRTVYLLESTNNCTAAWATEHFEYCIFGAVEKAELTQMALSACSVIKGVENDGY